MTVFYCLAYKACIEEIEIDLKHISAKMSIVLLIFFMFLHLVLSLSKNVYIETSKY